MKDKRITKISDLLERQVNLPSLLDEIPVGIAVIDADGMLKTVNRAWQTLTGADMHSMLGVKCIHGLRSDFCLKDCPVMNREKSFTPISREADIIDRSRAKIPIRLTLAPIFTKDDEFAGYIETIQDMRQVSELTGIASKAYSFSGLVGASTSMDKVFNMIPSIARTDSSVLITGETGTGKDMLAEAIHNASERAGSPFIKINSGALPETLLESELFGHVKGAFTGADENRPGRIRLANNGTLFLTEIGDLPLSLQVKLLSFLDDRVIYPVGGSKGFNADVRIIVATHRDLRAMVKNGTFRSDLLFRLNVVRMHLPPLRERGEDRILLKEHFLKEYCSRFNKKITKFSKQASRILAEYPYPGNVRELRNIVEYAVNFCDGDTINPEHLPPYLVEPAIMSSAGEHVDFSPETPPAGKHYSGTWNDTERNMIMEALIKCGGHKGDAAEMLGWSRSTLWRKIKKHLIED
ncbi:sigma-54 interaction domain-containing protein [Maridesulfovibrio bastinii]|uniref:sigma-54 interaction domain-containing protein n=1 Tax=Maridesulfovibrio bastinii TaxID=47157 RepID=UPI0004211362|nr:sigma-54-dependent Fis family transcriptional regulator [Maridesulfovibrio bastinii]